jgi:hypothetical protein
MNLDFPVQTSPTNSNRTNSTEGSFSSSSSQASPVAAQRLSITDEIIQTPRWQSSGSDDDHVAQKSLDYFYKSMVATGSPKGLSNASCLTFGDPRLSPQSESVSQAFSRHTGIRAQGMGGIDAPTFEKFRQLSGEERGRAYAEAVKTTSHELDGLLSEISSKLKQRTKMGAYQIRSTFKYFDRNGNGSIDFREFTQGIELMGFNYAETHLTALFAKFDEDCSGEIDYNEFIRHIEKV